MWFEDMDFPGIRDQNKFSDVGLPLNSGVGRSGPPLLQHMTYFPGMFIFFPRACSNQPIGQYWSRTFFTWPMDKSINFRVVPVAPDRVRDGVPKSVHFFLPISIDPIADRCADGGEGLVVYVPRPLSARTPTSTVRPTVITVDGVHAKKKKSPVGSDLTLRQCALITTRRWSRLWWKIHCTTAVSFMVQSTVQ